MRKRWKIVRPVKSPPVSSLLCGFTVLVGDLGMRALGWVQANSGTYFDRKFFFTVQKASKILKKNQKHKRTLFQVFYEFCHQILHLRYSVFCRGQCALFAQIFEEKMRMGIIREYDDYIPWV